MSDTLVLFLPSDAASWRWLRVNDGAIAARGEGFPARGEDDPAPIVAVAPADRVTLHWADLPDRSLAQSTMAARLLVADASATPVADLHVAVGREPAVTERPIGVALSGQMTAWLALLAENGVDPAAMIPSPMLLPRPETGWVSGDLGGERVVRGASSGFADEPGLTELVTAGAPLEALDRADLERAIAAAVTQPTLDLRQGAFARRRRRFGIDWALIRRLAALLAAILAVTLVISLVQIARYRTDAAATEDRAGLLARTALPADLSVSNADRQLDERLTGLRGSGVGFSSAAAAVFAAVRAVPGTEVSALAFDANGSLRVTIGAQGEGEANDLVDHIRGFGFVVTPSPFTHSGAAVTGRLTVTRR